MSIEESIRSEVRRAMIEEVIPVIKTLKPKEEIKKFYSVKEMATFLGFGPGKIREWFHCGKLPGYQIDGKIIFDINEVKAKLKKNQNVVKVR